MTPRAPFPTDLAVTGATGRIARMLRRIWAEGDIAWLGRGDDLRAGLAGRRCVLALAGVTAGPPEVLADNSRTALATLRAAQAAGMARVILFSSAAVYGRATGPLTETTAPTPAAPYGTAKADMERAVAAWRAATPDGPEAVILRLGNVAGADALLGNLGAETPTLDIFDDAHGPRRSYIGPVTLAQTLARLAMHPRPLPPLMNIAAPDVTDMADLLRAAGREWTARPAGSEAIAEVRLNTAVLQSIAPLPTEASDAARLVAEWREVTG